MSETAMKHMLRETIEESDSLTDKAETRETEIVTSADEEETNLFWKVVFAQDKEDAIA